MVSTRFFERLHFGSTEYVIERATHGRLDSHVPAYVHVSASFNQIANPVAVLAHHGVDVHFRQVWLARIPDEVRCQRAIFGGDFHLVAIQLISSRSTSHNKPCVAPLFRRHARAMIDEPLKGRYPSPASDHQNRHLRRPRQSKRRRREHLDHDVCAQGQRRQEIRTEAEMHVRIHAVAIPVRHTSDG